MGLRDGPDAYRADALASLVTRGGRRCGATSGPAGSDAEGGEGGEGKGMTPDGTRASSSTDDRGDRDGDGPVTVQTIVRVDAAALQRGHLKDGEVSEVAGVGPVPLATARRLMGMGMADVVIRRGVDVVTVCGLGRSVTQAIRVALMERDPVAACPVVTPPPTSRSTTG